MARPPRVDFPGAWHHIFNRGARRDPIFQLPEHCDLMLSVLARTVQRYAIEVHAYALMPNHYHLLVRTPRGNISRAMQYFGYTYSTEVNRLHGWDGPLFRGRFRNQLIRTDEQLLTVVCYVHLNAFLAGLAKRLDEHCWTSLRNYLALDPVPEWLSVQPILDIAGGRLELEKLVRAYRTGANNWPVELDLTTGFFTDRDLPEAPAAAVRPQLEPEIVLDQVCALTGARRERLTRPMRGRGANPARRFAMWAMAESTLLTHRQIASLLNASPNSVRMTVHRTRSAGPPIDAWMDSWMQRYAR